MTQKGGAGKSVLTNIISNEIIFWHLQNTGDRANVLVVDIDPQQTNTMKRRQDVLALQFTENAPEFKALTQEQKIEIGRLQRRYACMLDAGYTTYKLKSVNLEDEGQIDTAIALIKSGTYDYIFIDFPGTLNQAGTAEFFKMVQHIFIPTTVNPSDIMTTEFFLKTIQDLNIKFKSLHLLWNKFEPARIRKTDSLTKQLGEKYKVAFLENRMSYAPLNDCNTLIPASVNVNLNQEIYSVAKPSLQALAEEIITITNK